MSARTLIICILLSAFSMLEAQTSKRAQQDAFELIGLAGRTTNIDEAGPNGIIPRFWQRLMSENLLAQIPNRLGEDTLALYTEYASDENGAYTYVLGARVKPATAAPDGMRSFQVPAATYIIFPTARGPVEKVVPAAWQEIWKSFHADGAAQRAFKADFELYGKSATDPKNSVVNIYIGVK